MNRRSLILSLTKGLLIRNKLFYAIQIATLPMIVVFFPAWTLLEAFIISAFGSLVIHELAHLLLLPESSVIGLRVEGSLFVEIEVAETVSGKRALLSALAGPLIPFSIGMVLLLIPTDWEVLKFVSAPLLLNIFFLPFDILGVLGGRIE